jgi:hypothetical protein
MTKEWDIQQPPPVPQDAPQSRQDAPGIVRDPEPEVCGCDESKALRARLAALEGGA